MTHSSSPAVKKSNFLFANWFNKEPKVFKDQLGICKYTWGTDTQLSNSDNSQKYNVYAKVKAIHVYDNLVEVELLELKVFDSINDDILAIIKAEFHKIIDPRDINWEKFEHNISQVR